LTKIKVLHIATDYPGSISNAPTQALKNLVEGAVGLDSIVVVVSRVRKIIFSVKLEGNVIHLQIPKLPFGLLSEPIFYFAAKKLREFIDEKKYIFNVIHAHKLTLDGVIAYFLSKEIKVPLVVSVRGDTDRRFVKYKLLSRYLYRNIVKQASCIFWVSPWARKFIENKLRVSCLNNHNLPNICDYEVSEAIVVNNASKFIFVGRLDSAKDKGLFDILQAMTSFQDCSLDIYGRGTEQEVGNLVNLIANYGLEQRVSYKGNVTKSELLKNYSCYAGLLMPSKHETFGMVYVEALKSGLPILMCKGTGINGFVEEKDYIFKVSYGDINAIKSALFELINEQVELKIKINNDLNNGDYTLFEREEIISSYQSVLVSLSDEV
jgi:glycosyltransferase involved in cell wall biosynthesis